MEEGQEQSYESTRETKEKIASKLISTGERIKELSSKEVENRKVITGLVTVGLAELAVFATASGYGAKMVDFAEKAAQFQEANSSVILYDEAITSYNVAVYSGIILAAQIGAIVGVDLKRDSKYYESLFITPERTTPVSTHVLPALGNLLIKIGISASKKQ